MCVLVDDDKSLAVHNLLMSSDECSSCSPGLDSAEVPPIYEAVPKAQCNSVSDRLEQKLCQIEYSP
jgi:hypothetical protein